VDSAGNIGTVRTSASFVPPLPTLLGAWEEVASHDNNLGGNNTNRVFVVHIMLRDNASNDITRVRWGGIDLTQATEIEATDGTIYMRTETWYMKEATIQTVAANAGVTFVINLSNGAASTTNYVSEMYQRIDQVSTLNNAGTGTRAPAGTTVSGSAIANKDNLNVMCTISSVNSAATHTISTAGWTTTVVSGNGAGNNRTRICGYRISTSATTESVTVNNASGTNSLMSLNVCSFNPEP
jgi:hypothetical protein